MTARVISLERHRGRGRQPVQIEQLRDSRDELTALIDEGRDLAVWLVSLARLAQVQLARGHGPAELLDELERVGNQHLTRMTAAGAMARADDVCPDVETRQLGHGRAA